MKKLALTLLAVAALTALSCNKEIPADEPQAPEEPEINVPEDPTDWSAYDADKFLVSFSGVLEQTKADIDFSTGTPSWAADDLVLVYVAESGASGQYKYNEADSKFYPVGASDLVAPTAGQTVYVYYPWSETLVPDGNTAAMTLPAEFDGKSLAPMAGTVTVGDALSDLSVPFKNLGAILHLTLKGSDTVTAVELSNSNVALAGAASISWEGGIPKLTTSGSTLAVKAVKTAQLTADGIEYSFLLPPSNDAMSDMSLKIVFGKTVGEVTYEPYQAHSRTAALSYARNDLRHLTFDAGFFGGGDGSEEHPYIISSVEDFMALAPAVSDATPDGSFGFVAENGTFFGSAGAHYIQTADIDFNDGEISPIGTSAQPFQGVYDGGGKTLSNIKITASETAGDWVGVFGLIKTAEVKNVNVDGAAVVTYQHSGILIGGMDTNAIATNCKVSNGSIKGNKGAIGGAIGYLIRGATVTGCSIEKVSVAPYSDAEGNNFGGVIGYIANSTGAVYTVSDCHADAASTVRNNGTYGQVGGIVGGAAMTTFAGCTISDCTNAASITTDANGVSGNPGEKIGGIVGTITNGHIINCSNTGTITSARGIAGGIAGVVAGGAVVEACWSNGTVTGNFNCMGAIVGNLTHGAVVLCHGKGNISGGAYVGGVVGLAKCSAQDKRVLVHQCLSQANVTASTGSSACSGGVLGSLRSIKYGDPVNCEYAMVTHCVGWKASVKNTNTSACTRMGAFVGYVNSETGASTTNNWHTFIENCYTTLEDADLTWAAATPSATGGFIGEFIRGDFKNCFYRISNNTQVAKTGSNTKRISPNKDDNGNLIPLEGFSSSTLMTSLAKRTVEMDVKNGSDIKYIGSDWTTTGKNGETLAFPLPSDLVALGTEFYQ